MSGSLYRDRWIECTSGALRIRGYYFPWGTKTVPYPSIRAGTRGWTGTGRSSSPTGSSNRECGDRKSVV